MTATILRQVLARKDRVVHLRIPLKPMTVAWRPKPYDSFFELHDQYEAELAAERAANPQLKPELEPYDFEQDDTLTLFQREFQRAYEYAKTVRPYSIGSMTYMHRKLWHKLPYLTNQEVLMGKIPIRHVKFLIVLSNWEWGHDKWFLQAVEEKNPRWIPLLFDEAALLRFGLEASQFERAPAEILASNLGERQWHLLCDLLARRKLTRGIWDNLSSG